MHLTIARKNMAQGKSFPFIRSGILPLALSVVLGAQCLFAHMPQSSAAVWAAEYMPEAVAPSWNDLHSDAAKIIEDNSGTISGTTPRSDTPAAGAPAAGPPAPASADVASTKSTSKAIEPAEIDGQSDTVSSESSPANGKAIAAVTKSGASSADAAILAPVQIENKDAQAQAASGNPGETSGAMVGGADAFPAKDPASDSPKSSSLIAPADVDTIISRTSAATAGEAPGETSETSQKLPPQVGASGAPGKPGSLSQDMLQTLGGTVAVTHSVTDIAQPVRDADGTVTEGGVMVVDSDEKAPVQEQIKYENLPTDEEKTHIKAGAVFPVVISSQISSKTANKGDAVEARLKYDLKIGNRVIAHKGAEVHGHINYSLKARSSIHALVSSVRWYHNAGCLGLEFDEIINDKGEHLPLVACPARASRIVKNKNEGRDLGVNELGQITAPWSQQLSNKAMHIALSAAMAPAGVFSFGAAPVAFGLIGAANPSFALLKPVGNNVRHRRLKGFAWGFISGVPGGWIVEETIVKGQESIIKPGDVFLAEFRQEFDGEPASQAQLMPNATVKVHGQVQEKSLDTAH